MNNEEGKIWYGLGIDNTGLAADARKSSAIFKGIGTQAQSDIARMDKGFNALGVTIAGALGSASIIGFGRQLIDITGKFQTFEAVLTNTLNSPEKAKSSMLMISDFAATTPFQVDALTGSFVKLANQGFVPTMAQMVKLGDLASSTGKGFDQLTEAIIDAQVGEFERLKEFGIRASKEGENVTFTFKEQATQVDFTASSIRDYILSLGELQGVQGSNAEIAKTLTGQMSNLEDVITQKMNELGQSSEGVLSGAISGAAYLVENYEEIGRVLGVLVASYGTYRAALIAVAAIQKAQALVQTIQQFNQMTSALRRTTQAQILLNQAVGANPYVKLASILMTVGGLIWAFAKNSSDATDEVRGLNKAIRDANTQFGEESTKVKALNDIVNDGKAAYDARKKALKELQEIVPEYNANLTDEGILLNNNTDAIKDYLVQLEKQIKMKAAQEELEEAYRQKRKQEKELAGYQAELRSAESYNSLVARPAVNSKISTGGMQAIAMGSGSGVAKETGSIKHNIAEVNEELSKTNDIINELNAEIEKSSVSKKKDTDESEVFNKAYWSKIRDNAQKSLDALEITEANATEIKRLEGVIIDAQSKIDAYKIKPKDDDNDVNPIKDKDKVLIEGSIAWYEEKIKELKEKRDSLTSTDEIAKVDIQIEKNQSSIDSLNGVKEVDEEAEKNEAILQQYQTFTERYKKLKEDFEADKVAITKAGGTEDNIEVREEEYTSDLEALNNEVLNSIAGFEELAKDATDKAIDIMIADLQKALVAMKADKTISPAQIKAVNTELTRLNKLKKENEDSDQSRSLKEWQDMEEQLKDCISSFDEMGDAIGGVAGEIISTAGSIASSTLSVISGISQLVQGATVGMSTAASSAAASVRAVETASVILAVISAAIQIAMQIAALFNKDDDYQENIERLQGEIDNLQWELQNRDIVYMREKNIQLLQDFRDTLKETTDEVVKQYIEAGKLNDMWSFIYYSVQMAVEIQAETAKKLAETYANISYSDSTVNGMKQYEDATKQLESLAKQQILIQEQIDNENAKKKTDHGQIEEWEKKIEELGGEAVQIINEVFETIMGGSATEWANQLGDALFDAAMKGVDGMKAWGDESKEIVGDVMKQLLIQQLLTPKINKIFDKYKANWFKDNQFAGFDAIMGDIPGLYDELNGLYGGFASALEGMPDTFKDILGFTEEQFEREASSMGKETASQDSIDEQNGRLTVMQGHTYNISEKSNTIAEYTGMLVRSNETMLERLSGIESNTEFCRRLDGMDSDLSDVKTAVEDIRDRGIFLKKQ